MNKQIPCRRCNETEKQIRSDFLNQPANQHDQEVRKQAQSDMKEDLIKWIDKHEADSLEGDIKYGVIFGDDLINYLNKTK